MAENPAPPRCIGIILDGNRRWAKREGVSIASGHREGLETLKRCVRWIQARGIAHLVVFAFSTENWKRSEEEVGALLELMELAVTREAPTFLDAGVRMRFVGERDRFSPRLRKAIDDVEARSASNEGSTLWVCLSYGGRAEIVAAAKAAAAGPAPLSEATLAAHLWTSGMPDPDLIIRTGARHRLSNFLLWQAAYSELFFLDTLWPDFSEESLDSVLREFSERTRTFGV